MNELVLEQAVKHILYWEKGYVDHPDDVGGPTNFGITLPTLSKWLERPATRDDIRALDKPTAEAIYRQFYILDTPYRQLIDPWTFIYTVDMGVMHKPKTVAKIVQKAARPLLKVDGLYGPKTLAMANKLSLIEDTHTSWRTHLRHERVLHYARRTRDDRRQGSFVVGWIKRAYAL